MASKVWPKLGCMRPLEGSRGSKDPALWKTVKTPLLAEAKARMHEALGKVPGVRRAAFGAFGSRKHAAVGCLSRESLARSLASSPETCCMELQETCMRPRGAFEGFEGQHRRFQSRKGKLLRGLFGLPWHQISRKQRFHIKGRRSRTLCLG